MTASFIAHDIDIRTFNLAVAKWRQENHVPWNGKRLKRWFYEEVGIEVQIRNGQIIPYRLVDHEQFVMFKLCL